MKEKTTLFFKINLFALLFGIIIPNHINASNKKTALNYINLYNSEITTDGEEWKIFVETTEISIYYSEIKGDNCMSYKLKIVNHSNQKQIVSFGVAEKLADECKSQYKTFSEFKFRKIEINPNSTMMGDDNSKLLLLPATTKSIKELIQNLSSQ